MREAIPRWSGVIEKLKLLLVAEEFCGRHKGRDQDFTRDRVLTFPVVVLLLLQKTTRSIQRHIHSFLQQLQPDSGGLSVSSGGWTQARAKLRHTAFIELNQQIILPEFYSAAHAEHCQRWRGHRVLGVDGSTLRLPSHAEVVQEFGVMTGVGGDYTVARMSVLYDLLNNLGLDMKMAPQSVGEPEMVAGQFQHVGKEDVLIWDRGLTGFPLMAQVMVRGAHFIGRCSIGSFSMARELFKLDRAGRSKIVKQWAAPEQRAKLRALGLPIEMTVRFVSLRLPNGELEVLVTSLLQEAVYPTEEFLDVYHWRWNHETYHQMLKSRLDLENWTGQTLEAVYQDVHAAVFIANIESLLSQEVQEELSQADAERKHPLQINRAVSYHALKERVIDLFYNQKPVDQAIANIQSWMRRNPVSIRKRKIPRPTPSLHRSYHYQRNLKKNVF